MDEILIVLCFLEDPPIHRYVRRMCTCTHAHVLLFTSVCLRCMYSQQTRDVDTWWFDAGPESETAGRHLTSSRSTSCIYWVVWSCRANFDIKIIIQLEYQVVVTMSVQNQVCSECAQMLFWQFSSGEQNFPCNVSQHWQCSAQTKNRWGHLSHYSGKKETFDLQVRNWRDIAACAEHWLGIIHIYLVI